VNGAVSRDDLLGTWRLVEWQVRLEDGSVERPFGRDAVGYVVYTADGHMITTISRARRTLIGGDLPTAPGKARAEAIDSFMAYSGTFRTDAADVIHRVEMSLHPDWVDTEQRRHVELAADGRSMTLSTGPLTAGGRSGRHVLAWERVGR